MKELAIIIPIYNWELTKSEKLSITTLVNQLPNTGYDLIVIHPNTLSYNSGSLRFVEDLYDDVIFSGYNDEYFESAETYSELLRNDCFYSNYKEYKYMLIYQTDCLMFDINGLKPWLKEGFDYVGCPIVANKQDWPSLPIAGNGGFSLRKVSSFIKYTAEYKDKINELVSKYEVYRKYEDVLFIEGLRQYVYMDIPTWEDSAYSFAWDMNPDVLYGKTKQLPVIGCHAFMKNLPFWIQHIEYLKDDELVKEAQSKFGEFISLYYKI